jgi:hypothetical protein
MNLTIRQKQWLLRFVKRLPKKLHGECDGPHIENREIRILERLKGIKRLEILLHECLHAAFWDLDEEVVETVAKDIAVALWLLDYRETEDAE